MNSKIALTVSRYWHNPQILHVIWKDGISLTMSLEDFKVALKKELGSVRWIFRAKTFESLIDKAFESIVSSIKEESAKVV